MKKYKDTDANAKNKNWIVKSAKDFPDKHSAVLYAARVGKLTNNIKMDVELPWCFTYRGSGGAKSYRVRQVEVHKVEEE